MDKVRNRISARWALYLTVGVLVALVGGSARAACAAVGATVFVAPTGSDSNPCTEGAPCASFERAIAVARSGGTVVARGGTYSPQRVRISPDGGAAIVVRPAAGERVVVEGTIDVWGSRLEFRDIAAGVWYARPGARDLVFRNMDVDRVFVTSATNVSVLGGDIGPSVDSVSQIKSDDELPSPPTNILFEGVTFHDYTRTSAAKHMECLHVMAVDGLTIRNSRFRRCSIIDVSFNEHGATNAMRGILVENTFFDRTLDGGHYSVHFSAGDPCEATLRFNTFLQGISTDCPETGAGVRLESNIMPSMRRDICGRNGYSFDWNVYESGVRCGANDRVASVAYLDRDGFDLRLARGSAALGRGSPSNFPATDIEGQRRPLRWPPDAGADQRETTTIVPGRSIGDVRLGMARVDVEAFYGKPRRNASTGKGSAARKVASYRLHGGSLSVSYSDDRVVGVGTTSRYYTTPAGIGPGIEGPLTKRVQRLPWVACARAYRQRQGGVSILYAPAKGKQGKRIASVSIIRWAFEDC